MMLPEEEANSELEKRLQAKFKGFEAPVKDQVRERIFATLKKPRTRFYWIPVTGGLLLIAAFFVGNLLKSRTGLEQKDLSVLSKDKTGNSTTMQARSDRKREPIAFNKNDQKQTNADAVPKNAWNGFERKPDIQKQPIRKPVNPKSRNNTWLVLTDSTSFSQLQKVRTVSTKGSFSDQKDIQVDYDAATSVKDLAAGLAFIRPIGSVGIVVSFNSLDIPPASGMVTREGAKKPGITSGVKGIFSASLLQTFQLLNLHQSATDHIQNIQFAPLLTSRSLSYKLTAGLEKKHTQLLVSYTYLRNWNEYETGTNRVIAKRVGEHQYHMTIIGEKHLEDERSHLLGIGIRQRFLMPQNLLKNYSINLGMEYTRLISRGQDLVWGNIGFSKNIYQSGGTRIEIGPYFQYSFTEREVTGQLWKSRPYQVGISLGVKIK